MTTHPLKILYLWLLTFMMCPGVALYRFSFLGVLWASWTWMSISLPGLGKLIAIIALNNLFLFLFSWNSHNEDIVPFDCVLQVP